MAEVGSTTAACLVKMNRLPSLADANANGAHPRSECAGRYHLIPPKADLMQNIFIQAKKHQMASHRLSKPMQDAIAANAENYRCNRDTAGCTALELPGLATLCATLTNVQDRTWVKRSPTAVISAVRAMPMLSIMIRATHNMTGVPKRCSQPDTTISLRCAFQGSEQQAASERGKQHADRLNCLGSCFNREALNCHPYERDGRVRDKVGNQGVHQSECL